MAIDVKTRKKVLNALERGESTDRIASRFEVGERTVYRLQARAREGKPIEPDKTGPQGSVKLTEDDEQTLLDAVKQRPGITAAETLEKIKTQVPESTGCRFWIRSNLSREKTLKAAEQDRSDVAEARRLWIKTQPALDADSPVFLDESGAQTNMTTRHGRSPLGERCFDSSPHGHWNTLAMLSAIRATGVIEDATVVVDGAMDAAVFTAYAEQCLAPSLRCGNIVIMEHGLDPPTGASSGHISCPAHLHRQPQ